MHRHEVHADLVIPLKNTFRIGHAVEALFLFVFEREHCVVQGVTLEVNNRQAIGLAFVIKIQYRSHGIDILHYQLQFWRRIHPF